MDPKSFIIDSIKKGISNFPKCKMRYQFEEISNTHYIEVTPNDFFLNDIVFEDWSDNVFFNFIKLFPYHNLSFVSNDKPYIIDKVDFEIKGSLYDFELSSSLVDLLISFLDDINTRTINYTSIKFISSNIGVLPIISNAICDVNTNKKNHHGIDVTSYCDFIELSKKDVTIAGESDYAMAA